MFDNVRDDGTEGFLTQDLIHVRNLVGHELVHDDAAGGGFHHLVALAQVLLVLGQADLDGGVHIDYLAVVGDDNFLGAVEAQAVTLCAGALLGDVIKTQNHIL